MEGDRWQTHPRQYRLTCCADSSSRKRRPEKPVVTPVAERDQSTRSSSMSWKVSDGLARRSARRCRRLAKNPGSTWSKRSASKATW
eukprot:12980771-Alexandrium_andersonii.AAC.1